MALAQDKRDQLDGILLKLDQQNAPVEDVRAIVDDFKQKFDPELGGVASKTVTTKQITPYQPSTLERVTNFFAGTRAGKLGTGINQAITGAAVAAPVANTYNQANTELQASQSKLQPAYEKAVKMGNTELANKIKSLMQDTNSQIGQNSQGSVEQLTKTVGSQSSLMTPKQVIGAGIGTVADLATLAVPSEALVPGAIKNASWLSKLSPEIAARIVRSLAAGGLAGAGNVAEDLGDGKGAGAVAADAGKGFAVGAAGNYGLEGAASLIKKAATKHAADLYNSVLGVTKNEAKDAIRYGKQTVGAKLVEQGGLPGIAKTKEGIREVSEKGIQAAEDKIQPLLKSIKQPFTVDDVIGPLEEARNQVARIPGEETTASIFDRVINTTKQTFKTSGGAMSADDVNQLKRDLYQAIGKAYDKPEAERAIVAQAQTALASGIRQALEKASGSPALAAANAQQGLHLQLRSKIIDSMAKGEIKSLQDIQKIAGSLLRPGNLIRTGAVGFGANALGGPIVGLAAPVADRVFSSTPAVTARAKIATRVGKTTVDPMISALLRRIAVQKTASATR